MGMCILIETALIIGYSPSPTRISAEQILMAPRFRVCVRFTTSRRRLTRMMILKMTVMNDQPQEVAIPLDSVMKNYLFWRAGISSTSVPVNLGVLMERDADSLSGTMYIMMTQTE